MSIEADIQSKTFASAIAYVSNDVKILVNSMTSQ